MRCALVVVCGWTAAAFADSTPAPAPDNSRRVAELLEQGRKLEQQGHADDALAAFEACVALAPDDPVANAELGWAAYETKDYAKAEDATRHAIAHAATGAFVGDPDARPRAAALFNLGQILEARGAAKEAAAAYADALRARVTRAARTRLEVLDPATAAQLDPLAPVALAGPFSSLADACRDAQKRAGGDPDAAWGESGSCANLDMIKLDATAKLAAPFEQLVAFQMSARSDLDLAVKLPAGWYMFAIVGKQDRWTSHCGGTTFHVRTVTQLKRQVPELHVEYTSSDDACSHDGNGHSRTWGWDEHGVVAIGVGASQRPSATPAIATKLGEWEQWDSQHKQVLTDAALSLAWAKDGALAVTGHVDHPAMTAAQPLLPDDLDPERVLGHHVLTFP